MSTTDAAATLRDRAATLRAFARQLTTTSALDLGRRAGPDTWIGPTPDACRTDLQRLRSDLLAAGADLLTTARRFEQTAAELEAMPDPAWSALMGVLAYSPEQIDALRTAMRAGSDTLAALACADPAATDAGSAVRRGYRQLTERWLPLLDGIRSCTALTGYVPIPFDAGDLAQFAVYATRRNGWELISDPLVPSPLPSVADVVALAERLSQADPDALVDTAEERTPLRRELEAVAADPGLLTAFQQAFTGCTALAEALAGRWQAADDEMWQRQAFDDDRGGAQRRNEIDGLFAALGAVMPATGRTAALGSMSTTAATGLVSQMHLDADDLAAAAEVILLNVLADDPSVHPSSGRPTAGDRMLDLLLATNGAPTRFVERVVDVPGVLWYVSDDRALPAAVLAAATSPGEVDVTTAERLVLANIDWVEARRDEESWLAAPADLAAVLGPWLLQLSPINHEWSTLDVEHKHDLLAGLGTDPAARMALVRSSDELLRGLPFNAGGPALDQAVERLAAVLGMLGTLDRLQRIDDAAAGPEWRAVVNLAATAAILVLELTTPLGTVAAAGATVIVSSVVDKAQDEGWLDFTDECATAAAALTDEEHRPVVTGALVLQAAVAAAKSRGELDASVPDPPTPDGGLDETALWVEAVMAWKDDVRGRVSPVLYADLVDISSAYVNAYDAGATMFDSRATCPG